MPSTPLFLRTPATVLGIALFLACSGIAEAKETAAPELSSAVWVPTIAAGYGASLTLGVVGVLLTAPLRFSHSTFHYVGFALSLGAMPFAVIALQKLVLEGFAFEATADRALRIGAAVAGVALLAGILSGAIWGSSYFLWPGAIIAAVAMPLVTAPLLELRPFDDARRPRDSEPGGRGTDPFSLRSGPVLPLVGFAW